MVRQNKKQGIMSGKGDKPRKYNKKKYDSNFEGINWRSNAKKTLKSKKRNSKKKE